MIYMLAIALAATAVAQGVDLQRPLGEQSTAAKDARLHVYSEDVYAAKGLREEVHVPVDVCATANFTLDANVHVSFAGRCQGHVKNPYMAIYPSADCTGVHAHPRWYDGGSGFGPGHTLGKAVWGASDTLIVPPEGRWSIAFRCDDLESEELAQMKLARPVPAPPPPRRPEPRPTTASISDSACYIPGLPGLQGAPRFIFKRTEADNCLDIGARRRLKIYRNAQCPDGSEARLARYTGTGCRGEAELLDVDESMMASNSEASCIDIGGDEAGSFAFWCTGNLVRKPVKGDLFQEEGGVRVHYSNYKGEDKSEAGGARSVVGVVLAAVAGVLAFMV
jgi:hypothetical protein